jgi:ABC-type sugar transport system substrate-binding protein
MAVDSSTLRHEGFHRAVDARPDLITVMESGDGGWNSVEIASSYIMDAFTAHPELNGTFQHGGGNAGSIEGLRAIDRLVPIGDPDHVYISTNDADTSGVLEMDNGFVDAFAQHGGWYVSDATVQVVLTNLCLGHPVPRYVNLPMFVVTPDNIDTTYFFGANPAYPRMPKDYDLWPILDFSAIGIETPTSDMKDSGYNPMAGYKNPDQAMYNAAITPAVRP